MGEYRDPSLPQEMVGEVIPREMSANLGMRATREALIAEQAEQELINPTDGGIANTYSGDTEYVETITPDSSFL